jgi:hypothetical protein
VVIELVLQKEEGLARKRVSRRVCLLELSAKSSWAAFSSSEVSLKQPRAVHYAVELEFRIYFHSYFIYQGSSFAHSFGFMRALKSRLTQP